MNKFIKFLLLGVIVCIAICLGFSVKKSNSIPKSEAAWEEKYPAVFKTAGNMSIKLSTSNIVPNQNMAIPESMAKLEGTITNKFGIRDDILEYIINTVPKDNPKLLEAVIRDANYTNMSYYAATDDERLLISKKWALAGICVTLFSKGNEYIEISRHIDGMMRDTTERDKYMWDSDRRLFSWKVIGSGLSVIDERIACEKGDF